MAFVRGTQIFTNSGWKNVEDIAGRDKVLVRNFIGDAQFIQPFALKSKNYEGNIIVGGSRHYKFEVTPDHKIVHSDKHQKQQTTNAEEVIPKRGVYLKHRSRYTSENFSPPQQIKYGNTYYAVDSLDWYKLVGFVLRKGMIETNRQRILLALDKDNPAKDMSIISEVLNRLGLEWSFMEPNTIVVSRKSNVAMKLCKALGSRRRKDMYIPDKMIYNSTREEANALIDTFIRTSRKDGKGIDKVLQFSSTNTKLIDSLELIGLLTGYTVSRLLTRPAGYKVPAGVTKRDTYIVYIRKSVNEVSIISKEDKEYTGTVYEIDLFEGQVMIKKDDNLPIWMEPK